MSVQLVVDISTAESMVDAFEKLAAFEEVFKIDTCGKCKTKNITRVVREVDGNKYYELWCRNKECKAKLEFGCNNAPKKGCMYPQLKTRHKDPSDPKGKKKLPADQQTYLPDNGWMIYDGETKESH
jgi:hypothetical protein